MDTRLLNYIALMEGRTQQGEFPFLFTAYSQKTEARLLDGDFPVFLFVLQGSAVCKFRFGRTTLAAATLTAVDKKQLEHCVCSPGTVLLEYVPMKRMCKLLAQISKAFRTPCSDCVSLDLWLREWCWRLLDEFNIQGERDAGFYRERRQQLTTLLRKNPPGSLGNLHIALKACLVHVNSCYECMEVE